MELIYPWCAGLDVSKRDVSTVEDAIAVAGRMQHDANLFQAKQAGRDAIGTEQGRPTTTVTMQAISITAAIPADAPGQ